MIDFELIVPDGWLHIPTLPELHRVRDRTINAAVRQVLPDSLPRDKAGPWRRMLRRQLHDAATAAENQGARAVVMPVQAVEGQILPGSLLLSVIGRGGEDESLDPAQVLSGMAADAGENGLLLDIDGCPAVRIREVTDSEPIKRDEPSVRVSYIVAAPGMSGTWALMTYSVLTPGDPDDPRVQGISLMFDAVACTMRWGLPETVPSEDELLALLPAEPSERAE